jgi:hypothetical protein
MFLVTEADADPIRTIFDQEGFGRTITLFHDVHLTVMGRVVPLPNLRLIGRVKGLHESELSDVCQDQLASGQPPLASGRQASPGGMMARTW